LAERKLRPATIVVVGLGRFGSAVAEQLQALGEEVLGIDSSPALVQAASGSLTYVVQADATDPEVLRQLGIHEAEHAVVAIGDDMQSSILATANLADIGVGQVWAKAVTEQHARILERVGATTVVFPERDMGRRVAHRLAGNVLEYFQVDDGFVLVETNLPSGFDGRTVADCRIRQDHGVSLVGLRPPGTTFTEAGPDTVLTTGSVVLVAGPTAAVEQFARLS
jgi:trk system potassium uptake protein TrkA